MVPLPLQHLTVFVATLPEHVPPSCRRFVSVDGSVPGAAVTWDHHVSGERINLDAMPAEIDASGFDGIGTTLADTDALASAVAVMAGGLRGLPVEVAAVLRAASHRCDHLTPMDGVAPAIDRLGVGLHGWVSAALASAVEPRASETFARLCGDVAGAVERGAALPFDVSTVDAMLAAAERLDAMGRIHRGGLVAIVDLRGHVAVVPEAYYTHIGEPVAVAVDEHPMGGSRYTVGTNPFSKVAVTDLRRCLEALAAEEYAHGPPVRLERPGPGSENWGGRANVFGSPWNYGSRLSPDRVAEIVAAALSRPDV